MELPKFNKDKDYINYLFQNKNITDLEPFYVIYLANAILKNKKILKNQQLLQLITERIKEDFKNIICLKDNIKSYEKIRIMSIYFSVYSGCEDITHFNSLKIKNYILSERQDNSIMDKVYKFYFKFIELLTEDSKIFFYLLQLISYIGFFHKEKKVYTFDLTNINMVKKHSKSLFPESLIVYNFYQAKENDDKVICDPTTSGIALNEIFLLPKNKYNIDIDYNSNNDKNITADESDNIAMNIILYLFYEYIGLKKFLNYDEGNDSPKKLVKDTKLIKYNNQTLFKLLLSLENKGKLIHRPDLFIEYNEVLEKYAILRTIAKEKEIKFQIDKNISIEDEINLMCQKIDYEKYINNQNDGENQKIRNSPTENKNEIHIDLEEQSDEEKESNDEEEEKEKEKNEGYRRLKRILKKFNLKNDEELLFNIEKIMNQTDLSEEDQKDLDYLYLKLSRIY